MTKPIRKQRKINPTFGTEAEFIQTFGEQVVEWEAGFDDADQLAPAYTLVLGAGASRSAGIPLQGELELALQKARQYFEDHHPGLEHDPAQWEEWEELEQRLFMACLARANREPNLTHLITADLASIGIVGPILTTNFDDLMLAGFWALPDRTFYIEPHIIYQARSAAAELRKIRRGVPVVIKVHGHHTTYRLARFRDQARRLIPAVVSAYRRCPRPKHGFIVAGYSGAWNDGIMAILRQKELVRRKVVYWLFKGSLPDLQGPLKAVLNVCDVRFVEVDDSDDVFVQIWQNVSDENPYLGDKMLDTANLLSPIPMSVRHAFLKVATYQPKWRHGIEFIKGMTNDQYWQLPAIKKLQERFLPILSQIEELDRKTLDDELSRVRRYSARGPTMTRLAAPDEYDYGLAEVALSELVDELPSGMDWTRRNRAAFRIALEGKIDYLNSISLLEIIQEMSEQAKRVEC